MDTKETIKNINKSNKQRKKAETTVEDMNKILDRHDIIILDTSCYMHSMSSKCFGVIKKHIENGGKIKIIVMSSLVDELTECVNSGEFELQIKANNGLMIYKVFSSEKLLYLVDILRVGNEDIALRDMESGIASILFAYGSKSKLFITNSKQRTQKISSINKLNISGMIPVSIGHISGNGLIALTEDYSMVKDETDEENNSIDGEESEDATGKNGEYEESEGTDGEAEEDGKSEDATGKNGDYEENNAGNDGLFSDTAEIGEDSGIETNEEGLAGNDNGEIDSLFDEATTDDNNDGLNIDGRLFNKELNIEASELFSDEENNLTEDDEEFDDEQLDGLL